MKIGIIGCGYVASFYARNTRNYSDLEIVAAYDTNTEILQKFCECYKIKPHSTLENFLSDGSIELVLNLTNPRSHFEITRVCLAAGKHVYSEKPIAMNLDEAQVLIDLAKSLRLRLGCAPCGVLSNTAQTVWSALKNLEIGSVKLVYANYDDGMIAPNMKPWDWTTDHGAHWPAIDEFEIGCTYEHAGYFLTWLNLFFGPALAISAYSSCQISNKGIAVKKMAPDFSTGCIEYEHGVVARVTCGLVAPEDKSLTIIGDKGHLIVKHLRNDNEQVYIKKEDPGKSVRRVENFMNKWVYRNYLFDKITPWPRTEFSFYEKYPMLQKESRNNATRNKKVDFMLGVKDMVVAIQNNKPHRLSGEFGLHILEQIEVLQYPERFNFRKKINSGFPSLT